MPLGLRKNKLVLPLAARMPLILEGLPPVTRLKILAMSKALLKYAILAVGRENSLKLWKRLFPALVPPLIILRGPKGMTLELFGRVASG